MLPVPSRTLGGYKHWRRKRDFGEKCLVFVQTPEILFESTHLIDDFAADQCAAGAWGYLRDV
jgi:hypothetical protein